MQMERLRAVQEHLDLLQQPEPRCASAEWRPFKMHARSRLCIFNEVCLKYLIASRSFGKQTRLFPLIFDAEMNKCKTDTLISLFLSIVSVCCRQDVSARLGRTSISFCGVWFGKWDLASIQAEMSVFHSEMSPVCQNTQETTNAVQPGGSEI